MLFAEKLNLNYSAGNVYPKLKRLKIRYAVAAADLYQEIKQMIRDAVFVGRKILIFIDTGVLPYTAVK